jgi:catechol 2,3-dioxygenase-like lactoylglutathione lyase family enzyme
MITFRARNEADVQAFHAAALAHGGSDEGAPGTRPYYEPSFYVVYVRDPDGNKLACVYHRHDAACFDRAQA